MRRADGKTPKVASVTIDCVRKGTFGHGTRWLIAGLCALGVSVSYAQPKRPAGAAAPAGAPAGVAPATSGAVVGRVTVPAGQRMPAEMIVFLESTDPSFTFKPPQHPVVISQQKAKFGPSMLVVPVGTRVDFRNDEEGPVEHNVFSNSEAKKFDLGLYKPHEGPEPVLFDTPGAVRLRCSIHRYMDGVIYVTPSPYYAVVDKDGRFSMPGVKPGPYRLKTWQRSQRYKEGDMPVTVAAGKPADVTMELKR
jgi:plastocyanin